MNQLKLFFILLLINFSTLNRSVANEVEINITHNYDRTYVPGEPVHIKVQISNLSDFNISEPHAHDIQHSLSFDNHRLKDFTPIAHGLCCKKASDDEKDIPVLAPGESKTIQFGLQNRFRFFKEGAYEYIAIFKPKKVLGNQLIPFSHEIQSQKISIVVHGENLIWSKVSNNNKLFIHKNKGKFFILAISSFHEENKHAMQFAYKSLGYIRRDTLPEFKQYSGNQSAFFFIDNSKGKRFFYLNAYGKLYEQKGANGFSESWPNTDSLTLIH